MQMQDRSVLKGITANEKVGIDQQLSHGSDRASDKTNSSQFKQCQKVGVFAMEVHAGFTD